MTRKLAKKNKKNAKCAVFGDRKFGRLFGKSAGGFSCQNSKFLEFWFGR